VTFEQAVYDAKRRVYGLSSVQNQQGGFLGGLGCGLSRGQTQQAQWISREYATRVEGKFRPAPPPIPPPEPKTAREILQRDTDNWLKGVLDIF
jgi:hypothetical protein